MELIGPTKPNETEIRKVKINKDNNLIAVAAVTAAGVRAGEGMG